VGGDVGAMRVASVAPNFRVRNLTRDLPCIAQTLPFKTDVTKLAGNPNENQAATSGSGPILFH
jgi:hypothetical protein